MNGTSYENVVGENNFFDEIGSKKRMIIFTIMSVWVVAGTFAQVFCFIRIGFVGGKLIL